MLILALVNDAKFRGQTLKIVDDAEKLGDNTDWETLRFATSPTTIPTALAHYLIVFEVDPKTVVKVDTKPWSGEFILWKFSAWWALGEAQYALNSLLNDPGELPEILVDPDEMPNAYEDDPPEPSPWNPPL